MEYQNPISPYLNLCSQRNDREDISYDIDLVQTVGPSGGPERKTGKFDESGIFFQGKGNPTECVQVRLPATTDDPLAVEIPGAAITDYQKRHPLIRRSNGKPVLGATHFPEAASLTLNTLVGNVLQKRQSQGNQSLKIGPKAEKDENCYLIWLRNVRRGRSYPWVFQMEGSG